MRHLYYPTTKEILDVVTQAYLDLENYSQVIELRNKARKMRQGDLDVTQYFNAMTKLWQELNLSTNSNWCCPEGGIQYKKLLDKERVHDFLAGLNRELNEVRRQILRIKPLPANEEGFAEVKREEIRKWVMLRDAGSMPSTKKSVLAASG